MKVPKSGKRGSSQAGFIRAKKGKPGSAKNQKALRKRQKTMKKAARK